MTLTPLPNNCIFLELVSNALLLYAGLDVGNGDNNVTFALFLSSIIRVVIGLASSLS